MTTRPDSRSYGAGEDPVSDGSLAYIVTAPGNWRRSDRVAQPYPGAGFCSGAKPALDELRDGRDRVVQLAGILATRLGELGPSTATPVDDGCGLPDEIAGLDTAIDEIWRHYREQAGLTIDDRSEHNHSRTYLVAKAVAHLTQAFL